MNFLEGCVHAYTPYNQSYPGTLLGTGTGSNIICRKPAAIFIDCSYFLEDYFDSGWYFDAGEFYMPVSGMTHLDQTAGVTWSAFR